MNKPKSVLCHQYAVGRGSTGYGFIRYSWGSDEKKKDEFSISPAKGLQLRFSQLSDNIARILEIDPASTDYKHVGVFMTQRRLEAGTASIYTDVLITDQPDAEAAFQLLHEDNFLTPDQFS